MSALLARAAQPRTRVIIIGVWLVAIFACFGFNLPGKFSDAERNDSSSYLPGDAEATRALEATKRLTDGEQATMVIVYRREGGLTAADRGKVARDLRSLNELSYPQLQEGPGGVAFRVAARAPDRSAVLVTSNITSDGEAETIADPVEDAREIVGDGEDGLEVAVTGPAGFSADAIKVFEQINGSLVGAAFLLVFVLLIFIYRSPILLWFPLLAVAFAEIATRGVGYLLTEAGVTVNGQSSSILSVLVLGAGTDYALLLVARYREELRLHENRTDAMTRALRSAGPAIFASGMTVIAALLTLSVAELNSTASLGPIGAVGIAVAMTAMLTLLPAALVLAPRGVFWPRVPHVGDTGDDATHGRWRRTAESAERAPPPGMGRDRGGAADHGARQPRLQRRAHHRQRLPRRRRVGEGTGADRRLLPGRHERADRGRGARSRACGRRDGRPRGHRGRGRGAHRAAHARRRAPQCRARGRPVRQGHLRLHPRHQGRGARGRRPRDARRRSERGGVRRARGEQARRQGHRAAHPHGRLHRADPAAARPRGPPDPDRAPWFCRSRPALGVGFIVFDVVFGFPGSSPDLALFAFVFLVALGIDYNIFLMARVREESQRHGAREGMLRGLAVTGGVITSAGIVLAGTFMVLAVLPLVFLTEIGFVVAFGVLLDTLIVRSILVPALVFDIGPRIWWPSSLASAIDHRAPRRHKVPD